MKMTCGWCHRDADNHELSSSGPTRCQYKTHRMNCPATFNTKCEDQIIDGMVAQPEVEDKSITNNEVDQGVNNLVEAMKVK